MIDRGRLGGKEEKGVYTEEQRIKSRNNLFVS